MLNVDVQKAKLARIIRENGLEYTFLRQNLDEYGEPLQGLTKIVTLWGLWHESQSYVSLKKEDASTVRSKPSPQVLAIAEDAKLIEQGDLLLVGSQKYTVSGVHDPTNLGIAADISLEVSV